MNINKIFLILSKAIHLFIFKTKYDQFGFILYIEDWSILNKLLGGNN